MVDSRRSPSHTDLLVSYAFCWLAVVLSLSIVACTPTAKDQQSQDGDADVAEVESQSPSEDLKPTASTLSKTRIAKSETEPESNNLAANDIAATDFIRNRPIEVNNGGFVSSDTCRECHAEQFDSWHDSYHRQMTQLASPESVIGDFTIGRTEAYGRDFVLSKRDGEFWVNMFDPDEQITADSKRKDYQIIMTTGAHHMQMYWYDSGQGRAIGQLPVAWLRDTSEWVPRDSLFISPPPQPLKRSVGRWNEVCIKCHTTHGQPRLDVTAVDSGAGYSVDSHVGEFGISCEACHGPGEAHVAKQKGKQLANSAARDIVHPGKLDHRRSSELCGQCHGLWFENSREGHESFLAEGRAFRAGDQLASHGHVFGTEQKQTPYIESFLKSQPHYFEDRFWRDGMPRVSGSDFTHMMRSPCYQKGTMSCMSCHEMHHDRKKADGQEDVRDRSEWANDQLKAEAIGRDACLQCHEEFREPEALTAHTHHGFESTGSDCYNCHMPHTTYGLVKAIRSHEISNPDAKTTAQVGRPNACNLCHLDKTLAWTSSHLSRWYEIEPPSDLSSDQQRIADSILWSLSGDAGLRAIAAAALGWQPAIDASRTDWVDPVLGQLMLDSYDAVRHVAHKSLRAYPRHSDVAFRYTGSSKERGAVVGKIVREWKRRSPERSRSPDSALLVGEDGDVMRSDYVRLIKARDNRQVLLAE